MFCKRLLAVALAGVVVLSWAGSGTAEAAYRACPETHTLTINNGDQVVRQKFVKRDDSWRTAKGCHEYDVLCRDDSCAPWHRHGCYRSFRRAEEVACSLRTRGHQCSVRQHHS